MVELELVSRRSFLKLAGTAVGAGLFLRFSFLSEAEAATPSELKGTFAPGLFVAIDEDETVRILCHRSEMGQGVLTSLPQLIAEELDFPLEKMTLIQGLGDSKYGDQNTDGSSSIRLNWDGLRTAGAQARSMLVSAAAKEWGVPVLECSTDQGKVFHKKSKRSVTYGKIAALAAKEAIPEKPALKSRNQWKVIGKKVKQLPLEDIINGKAVYGIDVQIEGAVFASIERSPTVQGEVASFNEKAAKLIPGVLDVVKVKAIGPDVNSVNGIAVIATNTWAANEGRKALEPQWKVEGKREESERYRKDLLAALDGKLTPFRKDGDAVRVLEDSKKKFTGTYTVPYLVHAPMEPLNATASVKKDVCDIWIPIQDPQRLQKAAAKYLDLPVEKVRVHVTLLGGGFGRKSQPDFGMEAVQLSKELGKPVKVTWTREDEIQHGFYHAQSAQKLEAAIGPKGEITAWRHRSAYPTIMRVWNPATTELADWEIGMGSTDMPYRIPAVLCEGATVPSDVHVGWVRSVAHIHHAFAVNSFMDELAHHLKKDPIQFRLELLGNDHVVPALSKAWQQEKYPHNTGRMTAVIKKVSQMSQWGKARPQGTGLGFANHFSFYSYVATVIEASQKNGEIQVKNVYCAVDCGTVVNPDSCLAQVEGGIIFGLSLALYGKITLKDGAVLQSNFDDYPVLRMSECPKIQVELMASSAPPAGIGEPGTPPVAPALAGALFAATGKRIRDLPLA